MDTLVDLVQSPYTYPCRHFRCAWFGVTLHGVDGLFFLVLMLGLVLGLT